MVCSAGGFERGLGEPVHDFGFLFIYSVLLDI